MPATFDLPHRIENAYRRAIGNYIASVIRPRQPWQSVEEWLAELNEAALRPGAIEQATGIASAMARTVNAENSRSWRQAAAKAMRSRMIYRALQAELAGSVGVRLNQIVRSNADLISSIPNEVAAHLTHEIAKAQQAGVRPETIAKMMRVRFPELTRSRINLISRTEVAKASTALTEARCDELGIRAYIWMTSRDQRVRRSHRNMNGVIVFWNDPPAPEALVGERSKLGHYHGGGAPNCRCSDSPILSLDDISWPHRFYTRGRIINITRHDFAQLSGMRNRIAA